MPWSQNEANALEWRYMHTKQTIEEIARRHGRNVAGIEARIEKMGLVRKT